MTGVIFELVTHKYSTAVKSHIQASFINTTTILCRLPSKFLLSSKIMHTVNSVYGKDNTTCLYSLFIFCRNSSIISPVYRKDYSTSLNQSYKINIIPYDLHLLGCRSLSLRMTYFGILEAKISTCTSGNLLLAIPL